MAQSSSDMPDRHSSPSLSSPQIPSNSPVMSPEFDDDTKVSSPLCPSDSPSSSTGRPNSMCSTSSDSSSSSSASSSTSSNPTSQDSALDLLDKDSSTTPSSSTQADSQSHNVGTESLPRPVSPFRAPRPPPLRQQSSRSLLYQPTAMRSYMLPLHDTCSSSAPDPPVILPAENSTIMSQSSYRSQAPYFPFLSHAPSPENSWIEVETLQHEYKLHVRLPGFAQDGITLATKRRRILHVVADKWENGGGK